MRLILISSVIFLTGCTSQTFGGDVSLDITDQRAISIIESNQAEKLETTGKYERLNKVELINGSEIEVIEYVTPKGEAGYQILITKIVDGIEVMLSIGYGVEAAWRTSEFPKVDNTPSTTPE